MNQYNPNALNLLALVGILGYLVGSTTGCLIGLAVVLTLTLGLSLLRD
jgi:hypothetical protein